MSEERFFGLADVQAISLALEGAGFPHVLALHRVDKEWRERYHPNRPELAGWMWTIRLADSMIPMARLERLVDVCKTHGLTFWLTTHGGDNYDEGSGPELYIQIRDRDIVRPVKRVRETL